MIEPRKLQNKIRINLAMVLHVNGRRVPIPNDVENCRNERRGWCFGSTKLDINSRSRITHSAATSFPTTLSRVSGSFNITGSGWLEGDRDGDHA